MQFIYRANLSAANFPLASIWMAQSIVIPQYDENFQRRASFSGDDPDLDVGIPQVYFGHNIMPIGQGLQSIAYSQFIPPAPDDVEFDQIEGIIDVLLNRAFIASTKDHRLFIYSVATQFWTELVIPHAGWTNGVWTYANASGIPYISLKNNGVYVVDVIAKTLTDAVLTGLTNANVEGIFSSNNYLLAWQLNTVVWSSALNPTDFVPSIATGAGSGIPTGLDGQIVTVKKLSKGFVVYGTGNAVSASFTANIQFPWSFQEVANSRGLANPEQIADNADIGSNYAWTAAGLLKIQPASASAVFSEVSDFLAGRIFEDYNSVTDEFIEQVLTNSMDVKLQFVGSRFLVISYGIVAGNYTHALVFDTGFKRWGKLKIDHVDCFELVENADGEGIDWDGLTGGWNNYSDTAFNELIGLSSQPALAKRTIGFMQTNGRCVYATFDYGNFASDAIAVLGKYQLTRTQNMALQGVEVESISRDNANFSIVAFTTLDGSTVARKSTGFLQTTGDRIRRYLFDTIGRNHSIVFKGSFTLTGVILTTSRAGRV